MAKKKSMVAKVTTAMKSLVHKAEKAMGLNGKKAAKKPAAFPMWNGVESPWRKRSVLGSPGERPVRRYPERLNHVRQFLVQFSQQLFGVEGRVEPVINPRIATSVAELRRSISGHPVNLETGVQGFAADRADQVRPVTG